MLAKRLNELAKSKTNFDRGLVKIVKELTRLANEGHLYKSVLPYYLANEVDDLKAYLFYSTDSDKYILFLRENGFKIDIDIEDPSFQYVYSKRRKCITISWESV